MNNYNPIIFLLLVAVLFISCQVDTSRPVLRFYKKTEKDSKPSTAKTNLLEDTAIYAEIHRFPGNLKRDSITGFDSRSITNYNIQLPVFTGLNGKFLTKMIRDTLLLYWKDYRISLEEDRIVPDSASGNYYNEFATGLDMIYTDSSRASVCLWVYYYGNGAAHGYTVYKTFNYNFTSKKHISFGDRFLIQNEKDSTDFIKHVKMANNETTDLNSLYEYQFYEDSKYIIFCFSSYEACPYMMGMPKAVIRKKDFAKFLKNEE